METTEQRSGFRFPWTERHADGTEHAGEIDEQQGDALMTTEAPPEAVAGTSPEPSIETPEREMPAAEMPGVEMPMAEPSTAEPPIAGSLTADVPGDGAPSPVVEPPRRPTRFLADLTRAMHVAAETARTSTLDQFRADGKTVVEQIQARSTEDVTGLRHTADEDIAGVREWSKAEIARVREETEQRIGDRKTLLDRELEGHAAVVEREIEKVQEQVTAYEAEMDGFFGQLLAEEDPSRFAALAASLPDPPIFTGLDETERQAIIARALAPEPEPEPEVAPEPEPAMEAAEAVEDLAPPDEGAAEAAIAVAEGSADVAGTTGTGPADEAVPSGMPGEEPDPRAAIMGDLADAEAAALADVRDEEGDEPSLGEDSIVARLAGLVPAGTRPVSEVHVGGSESPAESSQVVVVGLTSVASIAAFKRQLGRLAGVRSVAVSSGPSGEFIFAVTHDAGAALGELVTSLAGFDPRVTRTADGLVEVTARDPEA
jgi:hypothetical protein